MPAITLKAHYDGQQILLDEPFDLPIDAPLAVTVFMPENNDWANIAIKGLANAYSDNEPEYSLDDIK